MLVLVHSIQYLVIQKFEMSIDSFCPFRHKKKTHFPDVCYVHTQFYDSLVYNKQRITCLSSYSQSAKRPADCCVNGSPNTCYQQGGYRVPSGGQTLQHQQ